MCYDGSPTLFYSVNQRSSGIALISTLEVLDEEFGKDTFPKPWTTLNEHDRV